MIADIVRLANLCILTIIITRRPKSLMALIANASKLIIFFRAICISATYAVMRCPSLSAWA